MSDFADFSKGVAWANEKWQPTADELKRALAVIQRVRELHQPETCLMFDSGYLCTECTRTGMDTRLIVEYPCKTLKALDGNQ